MSSTGVAVITGAARGIGLALTHGLLQAGYAVSAWDSDEAACARLQEKFTDNAHLQIQIVDVGMAPQIEAAAETCTQYFGQVNFLINNAAIGANMPLHQLSLDAWNRVIAVNLSAALWCTRSLLPQLQAARGAVINIASTRALMSEANTEAYSATKGGLLALSHAMSVSLGPLVRVNSISPGWIDTREWQPEDANFADLSPDDHAQHPAGRVGRASDIVNMVKFLLAPGNDFITGQNFVVDGGMTKKMIYI